MFTCACAPLGLSVAEIQSRPPSVQAFEMALRAAGADAATSVFCDDSTRNVKAARAAGIFSVLVRATALAPTGCGHCRHPQPVPGFEGHPTVLRQSHDDSTLPVWELQAGHCGMLPAVPLLLLELFARRYWVRKCVVHMRGGVLTVALLV